MSGGAAKRVVFLAVLLAGAACRETPSPSPAPGDAAEARIAELEKSAARGGSEAVARLAGVAEDPGETGSVRFRAITLLGDLGDPAAAEPLMRVLESDLERRTGLWAAAIPALGRLGDRRALPLLVRCLENREEDWLGREMSARALGELGDIRAAPPLIEATRYEDTRPAALDALHELGVKTP